MEAEGRHLAQVVVVRHVVFRAPLAKEPSQAVWGKEVFFCKDPDYEGFFEDDVVWNQSAEHWGMETETTGLKRTAAKIEWAPSPWRPAGGAAK